MARVAASSVREQEPSPAQALRVPPPAQREGLPWRHLPAAARRRCKTS